MIDRDKTPLPTTIDEVANLLLDDLSLYHQTIMTNLIGIDYIIFAKCVGSYISDEFKIYSTNTGLLKSCMEYAKPDETDPAKIILRRMKEIANQIEVDEEGIVHIME